MRITQGSVTHFTPDHTGWTVHFTDQDKDTWTETVIGWAVEVRWTSWTDEAHTDDPDEYETDVVPVLLAEGGPITLTRYRLDRTPGRLDDELLPPG